jgi:hypothetical protein
LSLPQINTKRLIMPGKTVLVTNEQILQEVMKIHVRLAEMSNTESARLEREKTASEMLITHEHVLNGNGKPGLKTEVQLLNVNMARINWLGGAVLAALVADIVSRWYK